VLRRPLESTQFTPWGFNERAVNYGLLPRWEPSGTISIMPLSSHSGVVSKSNFWIVSPGRLDFNSQRLCSIISRCSTIANDGSQRQACCHRSSSSYDSSNRQWRDSRNLPIQNAVIPVQRRLNFERIHKQLTIIFPNFAFPKVHKNAKLPWFAVPIMLQKLTLFA